MLQTTLPKLTLAWLPMCAQDRWLHNQQRIDQVVDTLSTQTIDIFVLPEAFALLSSQLERQQQIAECLDDAQAPIQSACRRWARQLGAYVVAGSIPIRFGDAIYATLCIFSPQGALVRYYRKIHLFTVITPSGQQYRESAVFAAGDHPVIWQSPWGAIGLAICYDVRFPALFRYYAQAGATLILLPAAFTQETGAAHWHSLVRARAIENQSFVLAVNQVGQHDAQLHSYGHSLLVDPWGVVLADSQTQLDYSVASIDLSQAMTLRQRFPVLQPGHFALDNLVDAHDGIIMV